MTNNMNVEKKEGNVWIAISIIVAGLLVAGAVVMTQGTEPKNNAPVGENNSEETTAKIPAVTAEDHFRGDINAPIKIVETANADDLKKVKFYIDCGDDDFLIKGNMALHTVMIDKKIPHEFRVRDGGHTWSYWRTALPEVLKFVGESFHR
jgi:S-formylglutathione hydrolase FrmB